MVLYLYLLLKITFFLKKTSIFRKLGYSHMLNSTHTPHMPPLMLSLTPLTSTHTSHLLTSTHTSHLQSHLSPPLTPLTSTHTSYLSPHTSHLSLLTSHLTSHISHSHSHLSLYSLNI
jgi:hypothetical protein